MSLSEQTRDGLFLVAGCGSIGKRHIANLKMLSGVGLLAVDECAERRSEVEQRFGIETAADFESALARRPHVVLICTPTHLHVRQALAAARKGCHLFVEKPVADTLDGLDELMTVVEEGHLLTLVGCNFRFHPGLRQVKTLLDSSAIGKVVSARAHFGQYLPDWHPWEDYRQGYSANRAQGGGVLLDRIHEIDYVRWLLGDITEVSALVGHVSGLEIDSDDVAEILVRFASGAFGSLHMDYVRRVYTCVLDITGEEGNIEWSYDEHSVRWYRAEDRCWRSMSWPGYDPNRMYVAEMEHLLRVLSREEASEQSLRDAQAALKIAVYAARSSAERRAFAV